MLTLTTKNFYLYENIKLATYLQVAQTRNYRLLAKSKFATDEQCAEAWEQVVKDNAKATGSFNFDEYFKLECDYATLLKDYLTIKAVLLKLQLVEDKKEIEWLKQKGYKFNYGRSKELYVQQIENAISKSDAIITRLIMKQNQITGLLEENQADNVEPPTLEKLLARISKYVGYHVPRNILLARYNEFNEMIRKEIEANERPAERNYTG